MSKPSNGKLESRKSKRQRGLDSTDGPLETTKQEQPTDSFEKYYNKELDLDEGNRPGVDCFRSSACCNLRTDRERDQLYWPR